MTVEIGMTLRIEYETVICADGRWILCRRVGVPSSLVAIAGVTPRGIRWTDGLYAQIGKQDEHVNSQTTL